MLRILVRFFLTLLLLLLRLLSVVAVQWKLLLLPVTVAVAHCRAEWAPFNSASWPDYILRAVLTPMVKLHLLFLPQLFLLMNFDEALFELAINALVLLVDRSRCLRKEGKK